MKKIISLLMPLLLVSVCACSQDASNKTSLSGSSTKKKVGGACEGCEAIHECPVSFEKLPSVATLPDFNEPGPKIEVSGIVYHRDGKTPAKDVVLYVYHTNQTGHYPTRGNETGWAKRHGYIRGWVKTNENGFYQFFTLRPAAYPNRRDPQHIHITVKEPDKNEYWIDDFLFADDPLLPKSTERKPRGGSGIVELLPPKDGVAHATRHIILGLNVPDYPYAGLPKLQSGLKVGSNCPAFDPLHLSGADKGKNACPMCKYGYGQGVMVWFNHANLDHMSEFVKAFENEMEARGENNLRVFFIYMNPFYKENNSDTEREIIGRKVREWCEKQGLQKVAITWIPSPVDAETAGLYSINPQAKNTVLVYKKRKVAAKWVNMEYDSESVKTILRTL
jgi:protocatechuate 3,4-dioxygenase, beta subunit